MVGAVAGRAPAYAAVSEEPLEAERRIGPYQLVRRLGSGGMATVYLATDCVLGRRVALKIPAARGETLRRFLSEARAMAQLSSPNIVRIYHFGGSARRRPWFTMEYMSGGTADQWLLLHPSFSDALKVYLQAGQGLAVAHAVGMVHRDFKPGNVLVDEGGRAALSDFGLAAPNLELPLAHDRKLELAARSPTKPRGFVGSPAYMAPEQIDGEIADARADIFSFCASLYEALFKVRPFAGDTIGELRRAMRAGSLQIPPKTMLHGGLASIRDALAIGLRHEKTERYATIAALLAVLQGLGAP
ncbi:MAG TPA: serine/threonine-protein kinase [Myxococcales bacterium]